MNDKNKQNLKALVSGLYDLQKLRIQAGNRIAGNIKGKLGQGASKKEEDSLDKEAQDHLKRLRKNFKLITDGLISVPTPSQFKKLNKGFFDNYTEMQITGLYSNLADEEAIQITRLEGALSDFPIYTKYLKPEVVGCGPLMAGVIISTLDPYKAKYPSSFHKYCGLDVVNGQGRSRKKEHLEEQEYTDKEGEIKTKMGISFNPFAKTKLVGVLGSNFIKQSAAKCIYRKIYDDYKHRLENHKSHQGKSKGHRHNMAVRYMIKRFLIDLHMTWRELEGLPVSDPYEVAKLGYNHGLDRAA